MKEALYWVKAYAPGGDVVLIENDCRARMGGW